MLFKKNMTHSIYKLVYLCFLFALFLLSSVEIINSDFSRKIS
ncbi:putative membrane protein [Synechococcus sp. A15-62]|nr:putative membrane protein [Synechococcus sp. A15-62]